MRFKAICLIICNLLAIKNVLALEICGDAKQGELLVVKDAHNIVLYEDADIQNFIPKADELKNKKTYGVGKDGVVLIALHRDSPRKIILADYSGTDYGELYPLEIQAQKWDIQFLTGVAQHKVTPIKSHEKEILREQSDVRKALAIVTNGDFWHDGFMEPLKGRISGHFGNQRVFNGVPKNPHSGTDIAAIEGTPVQASGSGRVVLSGKDYFYTGNMVIIDHGQGLQTIYAHLQKAIVREGDMVQKGDIIGYVGKTGRATGAHLHWGASLNGVRFRPHSLLDINEKKCLRIEGISIGNLEED